MDNIAVQALTDQEKTRVAQPEDLWTDQFALKIAVQDFQRAEQYRNQNCDWRWTRADKLYHAWVEQKYWQGTKQPRASLGIYLCFEQIESILPKIMQALFADNPPFEADPLGDTTPQEAMMWKYLVLAQLEKASFREILRRTVKSALLYGDGIIKLGWCIKELVRQQWVPKFRPRKDPFGGGMDWDRILDKQTLRRIENYPELNNVDVRDFYLDENCASPAISDARFTIERALVTVDYLDGLRKNEEFKIPSKVDLIEMSKQKTSTQGDQAKMATETFRMGTWQPWIDQTVDPGGQRIEILNYNTEDRVVWVANRGQNGKPILNIPNSYGFKPYYHAFYADVPGRFHALGICDVIGGEQQFQSSLRNARLDELSLALHRPLIRKIGLKVPEYQRVVKPGQQWEAENPKEDYVFLDVPNITGNAYIEDQYSGMRAQKTTGVTDLAVLGTPSAGGNSASRTATGVNTQAQASASRLQYLVENLEDTCVEPLLNDVVTLNKMFPPIGQKAAETIATSRVELSMRASAKMQSRSALMQTFPLIAQTLMAPGLLSDLAAQNMTVDWTEVLRAIQDMTGWKGKAQLVRPMTPEEKQARNQPPAEEMLHMQMQRERIQGQEKITQMKLAADNQESDKQRDDDADSESTDALVKLATALIAQKGKEAQARAKPKAKK